MSSALLNILIGLVTSVLSGTAVLLWRRAASSRIVHRKAAFFGLRAGSPCLIVMNNHWQLPGSASHDDVQVMLPGVKQRPISARSDSGAIVVGGRKFAFKRGRQEHALVAKFTPGHSKYPVILLYGQRAIDSRAAVKFLKQSYQTLSKTVGSINKFCLIIQVTSSDTYGAQAAELAADVTSTAFTAAPKHPKHPTAATAAGD